MYGHPYYTNDRKAPADIVERLAREHPTLVLAWNNDHRVFDVLAKASDKGEWKDEYVFILSWMIPCSTCGWRRWQKVNCGNHKVVALSVRQEALFRRLREIKVGTDEEAKDEFADKLDAMDKERIEQMEAKHAQGRLEGAKRGAVNLPRHPLLSRMPRSVRDLVNQARKSVPISVNGIKGR